MQDYKAFDSSASIGIALREEPLKSDRRDYLLLANRRHLTVVQEKKAISSSHQMKQSCFIPNVERPMNKVKKMELVANTDSQSPR